MPLATAPLARFVQAAGQLRAAWYDAKAYISENVNEDSVVSDQLHKLESAEELVDEAVANAESTLKACVKLCQATKSVVTQNGNMREKNERPWAAANQQSRQTTQRESPQPPQTWKRKYESIDSDWSSWKRAEWSQQSEWTEPVDKRAAPMPRRHKNFDSGRPRTASEWAALKRMQRQGKWYPGKISIEELHENILPDRLASFPQDRLCDLLLESIEKWLKKRNRDARGKRAKVKGTNEDVATVPLDSLWSSGKFKAIFPLIDPPITSLVDWVSENMEDTSVGEDDNGKTTLSRRRVDENDEEERERYQELLSEFLEALPEDSLTDEEEELRMALLSYLEQWDGDSPSTVAESYAADNEQSLEVYLCMWTFLPRRIKLRDWIFNRIGMEITIRENEAGSFVFQLPKKSGRI